MSALSKFFLRQQSSKISRPSGSNRRRINIGLISVHAIIYNHKLKAMKDALHSQRLTHLLEHFSAQLDELLRQLQLHDSPSLPLELLDEIAVTTGELMLVLLDYQSAHKSEELVRAVISHAQCLRQSLRSHQLQADELSADVSSFNEDVGLIIRDSKLAA
jgi:hypothetical protein